MSAELAQTWLPAYDHNLVGRPLRIECESVEEAVRIARDTGHGGWIATAGECVYWYSFHPRHSTEYIRADLGAALRKIGSWGAFV